MSLFYFLVCFTAFGGACVQSNWVCDDDWRPNFAQAMFFVGAIVGSLLFGLLVSGDMHQHTLPVLLMHVPTKNKLRVLV